MRYLLNWLRRRKMEGDLDRELNYHIERRVSDLVESGVPEPEARRRVAIEVGGTTQIREEVRDVWLARWLRDFVYDLRFSARSFVRERSFTLTAVLSLALGIGASTAIYSLVDQIVLRPLPVEHADRLVLFNWNGSQLVGGTGSYNLMTYPFCRELEEEQKQLFAGVFCRALTVANLSTGGDPELTEVEVVSGSYFPVLGVKPALGRLFTDDDDRAAGASPVLVLSYDYWKSRFSGATDILGRRVLVNKNPMTVVGVAGASFRGIDIGQIPSLWIPAVMAAQVYPGRGNMLEGDLRWMQTLGILRPDISAAQAKAGLQPWFRGILERQKQDRRYSESSGNRQHEFLGSTLEVIPAPQGHSMIRRTLVRPLWVLFVATGVLLSLACLNVAGLFLARGSARQREISTRLAIGALRSRIGRQLLADSILFAMVGGALGVVAAPIAIRALIAFLPQAVAANGLVANVDGRVLFYAFLVTVGTGFLAGCAPALQVGGESLISAMRDRAAAVLGGVRLRRMIVTTQIAFTLVLLVAAGLFVRTLSALIAKGPGFDTASLVSFSVTPAFNGYSASGANEVIGRIEEGIRNSPDTEHYGMARAPLLTGGAWGNQVTIRSDRRFPTDDDILLNEVTPGLFSTLGVRILAGRDFNEQDSLPAEQGGRAVAIVNEAFVNRYLRGTNPLGAYIGIGSEATVQPDREIVGVVENFSYRDLRTQSEQAWFAMRQNNLSANFYVRYRGTPDSAFRRIEAIVHDADPALPIWDFRTLDDQVSRSLNTERLVAALSSAFGILALLLSMVGLYGVMSFVVTRRTREIGIRLAMGATRLSAIWMVLGDALVMIAIGTVIALPCVWGLGRFVDSQLYQVKPTDPVTIVVAMLILCATAVGAALIPARRASAVNPTDALRFE
ncbi:MAG TPA: ABC transporter permease [Bryobacteraceae bacterium]|nr:ABC transporter permease [Bryobacteraceae bacterium]